MRWAAFASLLLTLGACGTGATEATPAPRQEAVPQPRLAPEPPRPSVSMYDGEIAQAALSLWKTEPGSDVFLDGRPVPVDAEGHFVLGFAVEATGTAELAVIFPSGPSYARTLTIRDREFPVSIVENLPQSKVSGFTEEQLAKIAADRELKNAARRTRSNVPYYLAGWQWPLTGRISTKMGSQRFLNGEPQNRPHSGTDIARVRGTSWDDFIGKDVVAPTDGIITLAEDDLYFEGGTIFIDHGLGLESAMLHLSRVDVKAGQVVAKGDVIGGVGMTGRANGPHLHWTVNWMGEPMDPELLVPPMEAAASP